MIVTYDRMWLTNVVTQEMLGARTGQGSRSRIHAVKGEIRTYAGGRQRAVGSVGSSGSWAFTLMQLTLAQTETLLVWLESGVTVFAKDWRTPGQSMYGTFFEVAIDEETFTTYSAGITLQAVDVVEGV